MIKSIARKTLVRKGAAKNEPRGVLGVPNTNVSRSAFYSAVANKKGFASVCVVRRVGGIGDVLMVTPALRQLKIDFPNLDLTFAIDLHSTSNNVYYELVKNAPFINRIIDARYVQHSKFDAVVDVSSVCIRYEHSGLPVLNRIDIFAKAMGIPKLLDKRSWYQVTPEETAWANQFVAAFQSKKIVVLHTASMEGKRCWPIEKYTQLVETALKENANIHFVILDFNNKFANWDIYENCLVASQTTLRQMAALISIADLFLGPDSGPMHLAGAIGVKSLVLFGSIPPDARINHYPTHTGVRLDGLSCLGCWYKACPYNIRCMRDLDSQVVYSKLKQQLGVTSK